MSGPHHSGPATTLPPNAVSRPGSPSPEPSPGRPPLNVLAVGALVCGVFLNVVGIVLGHVALAQIRRTGERGRGLALAGTIVGYVSLAVTVFVAALVLASPSGLSSQAASHPVPGLHGGAGHSPAEPPRSAEFCAALQTAQGTERNLNEIEYSAAEVAAYQALSEHESPHRELYARLATFMQDPTLLTRDAHFNTILSDVTWVLFEDAAACE